MRRAFLFSILFILLFTIFLLYSVFYLNIMQMNELNLAQTRNITRVDYVIDDIRSDLLGYLQLSVNISSNSTNTIINVTDTLPSPYTNSTTELSNYKSFINGTYANQTNLINSSNASLISLNTTSFESAPMLQFVNSNTSLNLNYSYTNLSKNELIVNGSALLTNYSISITLNSSCLNSNCSNATWAGGPPNVDSTTAGLWHFDEGSGITAYDSSPNGNTGTLTSLVALPAWTVERFGNALKFSSSNPGEVLFADSPSLEITGSLTIEMWLDEPGSGGIEYILKKGNGTLVNASNYVIWKDQNDRIRAVIANGTNYQNITSATIIQPNTWYHVAFTADVATLKLYINGVLDNNTPQTMNPLSNTAWPLVIGVIKPGTVSWAFNGTIDEVAIYSRAKSEDEIAADANLFHWDWSPIAMSNNLSAALHFDEGTGNVTYDSSGNENTGAFTGTQLVVLLPSSVNKAYTINGTSTNDSFTATTELNYANINSSNAVYETSTTSYSNTLTLSCQASGTCSCEGTSDICYTLDACVNYGACTATCPSAADASTSSTCTVDALGCSVTCIGGCKS